MLVLASASPRRSEILTAAGIPFVRRPAAGIDETPRPGEPPHVYVERLARAKAEAARPAPGEIALGADTTVVVDGAILGKPENEADARRMLRALSGRPHDVLTGICLATAGRPALTDTSTTRVWFSPLSDDDIAAYVSSGEPLDKAGAYGIQGLASKFIERVEGCYFNVVGLPVALVWRHLRDIT